MSYVCGVELSVECEGVLRAGVWWMHGTLEFGVWPAHCVTELLMCLKLLMSGTCAVTEQLFTMACPRKGGG